MFRLAQQKDVDAVAAIYSRMHTEEEQGRLTIGWQRGVYPERETAEAGLRRGDLFVYEEEGKVTASAIINQIQVDVYADADWQYKAAPEKVCVMHTLVVDPACAGRGTGSAFVRFYEEYARKHGFTVLRIDTNERNTAARSLYKKLGYREAGIAPCIFNGIEGVHLVLLEKTLSEKNMQLCR